MNNIDDIKLIAKIDSSNMRKLLYDFPCQCEKVIPLVKNIDIPSDYGPASPFQAHQGGQVKNIVVSGMGASSVGGDLLKNFLRDKIDVPLFVNRSYTLPRWVGKDTLILCVSYSGNTEETLSTYEIAKKRGSKLIAVSSGGELIKSAKNDKFPYVLIPDSTMPPRVAFNYLFFPQVLLLKKLGFVNIDDKELLDVAYELKNLRSEIDINIPKKTNQAKKIAEEIYKTIPLIYATSDFLEAVGIRWKTQLNENSKTPAYCELFPELDHNEIMGWEGHDKTAGKFSLILLRDSGESERMAKRINITCSLIKDKLTKIIEVHSRGKSLMCRMLTLLYIGDYVSFYLAMLNGVEPIEVKAISILKRKMVEE